MTVRVMLISPPADRYAREARVGDDAAAPDEGAVRRVKAAAAALPVPARRLKPPSSLYELADGLPTCDEPALTDWDLGHWRGRRLDELSATDPTGVRAWLTDPAAAPHGGESLLALIARVGAWLDTLPAAGGRILAVASPAVVRAAVTHALTLPPASFWRLDVAPLTLTELSGRAGRWNLRCGRPAEGER
ncbi:histidine phosphatase family protein [Streptomyces sp. NPDC058301]|uniref:histidine phosphatase family protein n=1 Tax=Streptomyces sp. NPDC058301 TaxID=3346436 RepID=UPI0036ED9F84